MGTTPQSEEPRVQVQVLHGRPEGATTFMMIHRADGLSVAVPIRFSDIDRLISDLRAAQRAMSVDAIAETHVDTDTMADEDLMKALGEEVLVTLVEPIYSSTITAAIAASGNYRHIWEVLDRDDSPVWGKLSDDELRALIHDYQNSVPVDDPFRWNLQTFLDEGLDLEPRHVLENLAKSIFVGRADAVMGASIPDPAPASA